MKKTWLICALLMVTLFATAQDAKKVFINMPDSLVPLLSTVNRADFIDFLDSGMKAKVKNKFGGESEMTDLTPSYIHIRMSDNSNWQMKLLPTDDNKQVICIVNTACAPVCESSIRFYTTAWEELATSHYLTLPDEESFYQRPANEQLYEYNQLRKKADLFLLQGDFTKDTDVLTFTYTTPDYLDEEEREKLMQYVRPVLSFKWEKNKFVAE